MTESNRVLLRAENLSCAYTEEKKLFENMNICLHSGEILGIRGMSGSGKTTLLYCLSGIIPHLRTALRTGSVLLDGTDVAQMKLAQIARRIGFVFQDPDIQLFSTYVEDDLVFGPENLCLPREEIKKRLNETISGLHLQKICNARTDALSGGQKQLAAIASVLTMGPQILIFDEITAQLDRDGKELVSAAVVRLRDAGKGIVLADHSQELMVLADRILDIERGKWIEC
jgi:energy-coupling factor transport system ATP-binding protein